MILTHLVLFSFFNGASASGGPAIPYGSHALLGVGL